MNMKKNRWPMTLLLAGAVAWVGCGSDDDSGDDAATPGTSATGNVTGADSAGDDDGSGDDTATPATDTAADATDAAEESGGAGPSFEDEVAGIIMNNCSCHQSEAPPNGLNLSTGSAYASLVGVDSTVGITYVTPGDSAASYIVNKLDGTHLEVGGDGSMMPLGGVIAPADLDAITAWIDGGAAE